MVSHLALDTSVGVVDSRQYCRPGHVLALGKVKRLVIEPGLRAAIGMDPKDRLVAAFRCEPTDDACSSVRPVNCFSSAVTPFGSGAGA